MIAWLVAAAVLAAVPVALMACVSKKPRRRPDPHVVSEVCVVTLITVFAFPVAHFADGLGCNVRILVCFALLMCPGSLLPRDRALVGVS